MAKSQAAQKECSELASADENTMIGKLIMTLKYEWEKIHRDFLEKQRWGEKKNSCEYRYLAVLPLENGKCLCSEFGSFRTIQFYCSIFRKTSTQIRIKIRAKHFALINLELSNCPSLLWARIADYSRIKMLVFWSWISVPDPAGCRRAGLPIGTGHPWHHSWLTLFQIAVRQRETVDGVPERHGLYREMRFRMQVDIFGD